ncbi:GerAB/ArcD/ProY family transporter [Paenibacillus sp. GCM10012303]|uniref:GerAB/ArcD/ProY family transporter n=1 Tax=Paenibacillus sp. GCM10012303 TaxID=3317340 RepID=UPI0036D43D08
MAGKALQLLFLLFSCIFYIVRDYGEFIVLNYYFQTPVVIMLGSMILLCIWAVRKGIDVLARCVQLFVPAITLSWWTDGFARCFYTFICFPE